MLLASTDAVVLVVGGEHFPTNRSTLQQAGFFRAMFDRDSNWQESEEVADIILDRDADVFRVLLSILRCGPGCACAILPQHDNSLCVRILKDAEFFGVDFLLAEVKEAVQRNSHPRDAQLHTPAAFDEEYGGPGLNMAIQSGIVPRRIFSALPALPPSYPLIKQLIPAAEGAEVLFKGLREGEEELRTVQAVTRKVACYALVERAGRTSVEPVVARQPDDFVPELGASGVSEGSMIGPDGEINRDSPFDVRDQLVLAERWATAWDTPDAEFVGGRLYWVVRPCRTTLTHRDTSEYTQMAGG